MSQIDTHVRRVRNKLALAEFVHLWAQSLLVATILVLAYVLLRQFTLLKLPGERFWLIGLASVTFFYALTLAIARRPGAMLTAVAIDDRLGLFEKFSTALHARQNPDAFAQAAVLDAEQAAKTVDLHKQFPIKFPTSFGYALFVAIVSVGLLGLIEPRNLFASDDPTPPEKKPEDNKAIEQARDAIKKTIAAIELAPKAVTDAEAIQLAKAELRELARAPNLDPKSASRKALSALQDLEQAKLQVAKSQKFADARNNEKMLEKMDPGDDAKGPVADAQRDIAKGNLGGAIEKLDEVVEKFDQMDPKKQEEAAKQMQQMAKQLQQLANNPQQQQQMQQKLQQMGMNQQQAQQAMNALQQAAQGNPQAQQQLQQMAQQAMQQMNGGQGPTQAQQQQVQQMLKQLQSQANTQAQAQQMSQAAQAMAQAMQQQANPGQSPNPGQQNPNGQQPGQPAAQTPQQQMAKASQQMQQQLQNMQAIAQDAQQVAAAQQAAAAAQQAAQGASGGPGQGDQGQGQGNNNGQGNQPGDNQGQPGGGGGNEGPGGGMMDVAEAPFTIKEEISKSKDNKDGKIIAATFVKADALRGESKAAVKEVAESAVRDATDEVNTERVSRQAQKVVKDYFGSMGE
jgi:hypothetical protein